MIVKNNKCWIVSTLNNGSVIEFNKISFYVIKLNVKVCNYSPLVMEPLPVLIFFSVSRGVQVCPYFLGLYFWNCYPLFVFRTTFWMPLLPSWQALGIGDCVHCMQAQQLRTFGFGEVEITHLGFHRWNYKIINMFFSAQPSGYTVGSS